VASLNLGRLNLGAHPDTAPVKKLSLCPLLCRRFPNLPYRGFPNPHASRRSNAPLISTRRRLGHRRYSLDAIGRNLRYLRLRTQPSLRPSCLSRQSLQGEGGSSCQ